MAITHLIVDNGNYSVTVANKVVKNLYDLVKALYVAVPNHTTDDCYIRGTISVEHAHPSRVEFLEEEFEDLHITVTGTDYIDNEDPNTINNLATLGDGAGLTIAAAAALTGFPFSFNFRSSTLVDASFLQYFTGLASTVDMASYFANCTSLTTIILPSSLKIIGNQMFRFCTSLTSIVIPEGVTRIDFNAFYNCTSLTDITFPSTLETISDNIFDGCAWYSNLPNGVVYVGNIAYKYKGTMPNNTSIILDEGTTIIHRQLFSGQYRMISITIPDTVVSIGDQSFRNCRGLTSISLPSSLESIGGAAFMSCDGLLAITIPNAVTILKAETFSACSSLASVTLGTNLTTIENQTFRGCSALTGITLPNTLTTIGNQVFASSGLESITIPASVTSIGTEVFNNCNSLASMSVVAGNTKYDSRDNCNAIIETATNTLIYGCQNTVIPQSVAAIGDSAFYGCASLTSFTIPSSVKQVGRNAFMNTAMYNSASTGVFYVDGWACGYKNPPSGVAAYYSININAGTVGIADYAFHETDYCSSIYIPSSVKVIGRYAIGKPWIDSITIPEGVTTILDYAFSGCSKLTSLTFPQGVTYIGNRVIGSTGVTSIQLPSSLTNLGENAFYSSSLVYVTIKKETPIQITSNTFSNRKNSTLRVPYGCAAAYQAAAYWKEFKSIIELPEE